MEILIQRLRQYSKSLNFLFSNTNIWFTKCVSYCVYLFGIVRLGSVIRVYR